MNSGINATYVVPDEHIESSDESDRINEALL